jgi:hypothetical protein
MVQSEESKEGHLFMKMADQVLRELEAAAQVILVRFYFMLLVE